MAAALPASKAIIVGSGAGSVVAMELAQNGWAVVIFEKGSNYHTNLDGTGPSATTFSNDELKALYRYFEQPRPHRLPTHLSPKRSPAGDGHRPAHARRPVRAGGRRELADVKKPDGWVGSGAGAIRR